MIKAMYCLFATVLLLLLKQGSSCDDFIEPNACVCPGSSVQYSCTVNDPSGDSATRWRGSAFDCTGGQASLFHDQYSSGGAADTCNGEMFNLRAEGLPNVTANCYTSVLTVQNVDARLDGRTVECGTTGRTIGSIIGSTTVQIAVPLPAPSIPEVDKPHDNGQEFIITWTPPTTECGNAVTYMYPGLAGSTCGQCTGSSDTPSVTCTGWTAQGQSCSIVARADVCGGGQQGEESEPVIVTLQSPPVPEVQGTPVYNEQGILQGVLLLWSAVDSTGNIAESGSNVLVDGAVVNYIVQSTTDVISADIQCNDTQCQATVLLYGGTGQAELSVAAENFLTTGEAVTVGPYERAIAGIEGIDVDVSGGRVPQLTVRCPVELGCLAFEFRECNSSMSFEAEMVNSGVFSASELNSTTLYCYRLHINNSAVHVPTIIEGTFATETYPCSSAELLPEGDPLLQNNDCSILSDEGLEIYNGEICYRDLLPSSIATYQCDPGFCLDVPSMEEGRCVESYNRTCQDNQMFSLQPATCIPLPTCPNTELIFSQISIEQRSAVYRCTKDFGISNPLLMYTPGVGWGEPPCCSAAGLSVGTIVGIILVCVTLPQILVGILVLLVVFYLWYSRREWSTGTKCGVAIGVLFLVPLIGLLLVGIPITVWLCLQCCRKSHTVNFTMKAEEKKELKLDSDDQPRYQECRAVQNTGNPLFMAVAERDKNRADSHPIPPDQLAERQTNRARKSMTLPLMFYRQGGSFSEVSKPV